MKLTEPKDVQEKEEYFQKELNIFFDHINFLRNELINIKESTGIEMYVCFRIPTKKYLHLYGSVRISKTLHVEYDPYEFVHVENVLGKPRDIKDKSSLFDGSYHPDNKQDTEISVYEPKNTPKLTINPSKTQHVIMRQWKTLPFLTHISTIDQFGNRKPEEHIYIKDKLTKKIYDFIKLEGEKSYRYLFYPYYDIKSNKYVATRYKEIEDAIKQIWIDNSCYLYPKNRDCLKSALNAQAIRFTELKDTEEIKFYESRCDQTLYDFTYYKGFIMLDEFKDSYPNNNFYIGKFLEITVGGAAGGHLKAVTNDLDIVTLVNFYSDETHITKFKETYPANPGELGYASPIFMDYLLSTGGFIERFQEEFGFSIFMHGPECSYFRGDDPPSLSDIANSPMAMIGPKNVYKITSFSGLLYETYRLKTLKPIGRKHCTVIINASWLNDLKDVDELKRCGFIDGYDQELTHLKEIFKYYPREQDDDDIRASTAEAYRKFLMKKLSTVTRTELESQIRTRSFSNFYLAPLPYLYNPSLNINLLVYIGGLSEESETKMMEIFRFLNMLGVQKKRRGSVLVTSKSIKNLHESPNPLERVREELQGEQAGGSSSQSLSPATTMRSGSKGHHS